MRLRAMLAALAFAGAATLVPVRNAQACGGCYHRAAETETTVVTGHRMAVAVSTTQTVLWDQIEYAGNPSDFAWVLPVRPGARVELATAAWFETLDSATAVHVVGPPLDCAPPPQGDTGFGCGSSDDIANGSPEGEFGQTVTIVHQGTVGPYETVTLSTKQPGALNTWLSQHGYAVGADIQPVIDAYVAEGFDFIALRLQPGVGVRRMKPVRVVSPGATPTFPLRMVAAGAGPHVGITLFVIGEGRWTTQNFPNALVPLDDLSWDYLTSESNYTTLRQTALGASGGRTWLTTFAQPGALLEPIQTALGDTMFGATSSGEPISTIGQAYVRQALSNGETTADDCDAGLTSHASDGSLVVAACPSGSSDPSTCPSPGAGKLDARTFACGSADDLAVALTGMHPRDVWLARLEADLPRSALDSDLVLAASSDQASVANWLSPRSLLHAQDVCRASGTPAATIAPARTPPRGGRNGLVIAGLAAALVIAGLRRQRKVASSGCRGR